jgi:hypothetical protein
MASNPNYSKFGYHRDQTTGQQDTNTLFRIIENGIDSIIVKLKLAVDQKGTSVDGAIGTNPRHIKAVENIIQVFEQFKTGHYTDLEANFKTSIEDRDNVEIYPNKYGDTYEDIKKKLKENKENAQDGQTEDGNEYTYNIDNEYTNDPQVSDHHVIQKQQSRVSDNIQHIQTRLNSCVNLEFLYLKKHNEIINIFSFVVDLFDKYKYAIKVILFLLKNLVRNTEDTPPQPGTPDTPGTPLTVNLPNPVIKNIDLLLKDQHNIEQIVEGMRNVVNNVDTSIHPVLQDENDNTKYVRDEQAETQIEHNVKSSVASSPSA